MKLTKMRTLAASCAGSLMLLGSASAAFLDGEVLFVGEATTVGGTSPTTMEGLTPVLVSSALGFGDYSPMTGAGVVTMSSFDFGPTGTFVTDPPTPFILWAQAGSGFYFVLEELTVNEETTAGDRELAGNGLAYAPGYDPTPAYWDLRTTGTGSTFFFVSDTTSTAVPDGGATIALLGASLLTLPLLRSKRAR